MNGGFTGKSVMRTIWRRQPSGDLTCINIPRAADPQTRTTMELFEAIHARQSVRAYQSTEVEADKLNAILSAANQSPSAGNLQAYQIILIRERSLLAALAKATYNQDFLTQAPVVLVFCADVERSGAKYGVAGEKLFCVQDATIATAYAQLAATALGLATCWIGAFDEQKVTGLLSLKPGLRPVAILPVGWPAESPERTPRRSLEELVTELRDTPA
jgi:nitroreductase